MLDLTPTASNDPEALRERLNRVPKAVGVYQWKGSNGDVLYVGKSKNLHDRMRSYFGAPRSLTTKTHHLVRQIADFDIFLTRNELEALLLEMSLIKQYRPRYNILLKDDKSYPYIKVTIQEAWPRIFSTRTLVQDGARYFGPYPSARSVRTTLDLLNRLFAFRPHHECSERKFAHHQRIGKPCLYHEMNRCLGPCVPGLISQEDYYATIMLVCRFLEGKSDQMMRDMRARMEQAAEELAFEKAAALRNQIRALERVLQKQHVVHTSSADHDVIAVARQHHYAVVQMLFVRGGALVSTEPYTLRGTEDEETTAILTSFITQFYDRALEIPPSLLLAEPIEDVEVLEHWLSTKSEHRVKIAVPRRGEKRRLIELAANNASQQLTELDQHALNSKQRITSALSELRDILGLAAMPQRIECYDISNTQGSHSVASMVVFEQGKPRPSEYRRFQIKTVVGPNDVASMREVVERRFRRVKGDVKGDVKNDTTNDTTNDTPQSSSSSSSSPLSWGKIPDLVLVDGGRGQVNAVRETLHRLSLGDIPVAGVAKGEERNRFDLIRPDSDTPIVLARDSLVRHLVQRIDEEAHRVAITYHRKHRDRASLRSPLDDVVGIGPRRKKALMSHFGSFDAIRQATVEELTAVAGMNRTVAEAVKKAIGG